MKSVIHQNKPKINDSYPESPSPPQPPSPDNYVSCLCFKKANTLDVRMVSHSTDSRRSVITKPFSAISIESIGFFFFIRFSNLNILWSIRFFWKIPKCIRFFASGNSKMYQVLAIRLFKKSKLYQVFSGCQPKIKLYTMHATSSMLIFNFQNMTKYVKKNVAGFSKKYQVKKYQVFWKCIRFSVSGWIFLNFLSG